MTVINQSSISGITSITMPSGDGNVLTVHTNDGTERFRIDSSGNVKVGSAATISPDGDLFVTGVCTATTLSGAASGLTGTLPAISGANLTSLPAANLTGALPAISGANLTGIAATDNVRTGILDVAGIATFRNDVNIGAAVTISESGIEASGIGITVANINGAQIGGRRNIIINGAMQVAQRGTSSTTSASYTTDRFLVQWSGADEAPTYAQVDVSSGTTPYTLGLRKALKITNGNQSGGAGVSDYMFIKYTVEAQDTATSGWNFKSANSFVTLSFWVKSSVAQNFYGYIEMPDSPEQVYPFETGSLTADTWTKITKSIPGNSNIVVNNDNGEGFKVFINQFWGTTFTSSGRALNTWAAFSSGERMPDFTSTWYTTDNATFELTGVQLEVGSQATPFEHRSIGEELSLCQRYYINFLNYDGQGTNPESNLAFAVGTWYNSTYIFCPIRFPVPMRTGPTLESSSNTNDFYALYGAHVDYYNENGLLQASNMGARIYPIVGTANQGSSGTCTVLHVELASTAQLRFNAEL